MLPYFFSFRGVFVSNHYKLQYTSLWHFNISISSTKIKHNISYCARNILHVVGTDQENYSLFYRDRLQSVCLRGSNIPALCDQNLILDINRCTTWYEVEFLILLILYYV